MDLLQLREEVREAQRHLNMAGHYAVITGDQIRDYLRDVGGG